MYVRETRLNIRGFTHTPDNNVSQGPDCVYLANIRTLQV